MAEYNHNINNLLIAWNRWLHSFAVFCSKPRAHPGLTQLGERCPCGAVGPHDEAE